jgi:non-specific protein-tyrosine kinase
MFYEKSIEKAKIERQQKIQSDSITEYSKTRAPEKDGGWLSPNYTHSRRIPLDFKQLLSKRCVGVKPESPEIGYYKLLRTQIQFKCQEMGWNTLMVTSARPGEGKTLTAINLALTFAKEFNQTSMLVDCDLRRQNIHRTLGYQSKWGVIDFLMDDVPLKDIICWPEIEKLTLISGGRTVHNSTELLGSRKMRDLVKELKHRYKDRYVIFDMPPLMSAPDAVAFAPMVDGIVVVVRAANTPLPEVQKALELIPRDKIIGFVLNRSKHSNGHYNKYYHSSY